MGKKRKNVPSKSGSQQVQTRFNLEERFDDSEDDFYAGRDKILLDDGPTAKRRRRMEEQEQDIQLSDEEVLAQQEDEDNDDDDDFDEAQSADEVVATGSEEEEDTNWGTTKADYYNTDVIETEADALDEEQEARRLQQRQLKNMSNADFGFDELEWTQQQSNKASSKPVVEKLPQASIPQDASEDELLSILSNRYPEFSLLARDFIDLQDSLNRLRAASQAGNRKSTSQTKLNALASYLGAIAMYFAVISSTADAKADRSKITALSPNDLREHTVINNLTKSKQLWDAVRNIEEIDADEEEENLTLSPDRTLVPGGVQENRIKVVEPKKPKKSKVSRQPSTDSEDLDQLAPLPEKVEKKSKPRDLQSLLAQTANTGVENGSDFGDEDPLSEQQMAEKIKKKKSLRFYTSQIAQKANKRGAASRDAGGDDDVPRKERMRDKQERLLHEAAKRGQQKATADEELDGMSEDDIQHNNAANGDNYYESLVTKSNRKKAEKQARAEAYAEAARQGAQVHEEEQIGPDGKRRITYAIEKNKGLAPKRNKDVRNPRVKKRKKYDEKMKKLSSIRQVYKGGEGRGGYGGELTGIKTNIVKSVKL